MVLSPFFDFLVVAPALCSSFKGVLPSDLRERYMGEGGHDALQIDLCIASEMAERINEQTEKAKTRSGDSAVARRNQLREERKLSGSELGEVLKDALHLNESD